jgi:hypothetical protein
MRVTRIGAAALLSMSFLVGCSAAPAGETASTQSSLRVERLAEGRWSDRIINFSTQVPRGLPPQVNPRDPSYIHGDDGPAPPIDPACMVCPVGMNPVTDGSAWLLGGRPDPVEIAAALGRPDLAAPIADRILDTESQLAETSLGDTVRAKGIVNLLASDLNELAQKL